MSSGWGEGSGRGEPVPGLLEVLAGTATAPPVVLDALPGLTWAYSGGGYLVVAQVICDITGLEFDEAMAELVLGPPAWPRARSASRFRPRWSMLPPAGIVAVSRYRAAGAISQTSAR